MNNTTEAIVNNNNLETVGRSTRLETLINNNPAQRGYVPKATLTATFEAILGAVFLDCGKIIDPVRSVMAKLELWPTIEH